MPLLEKAFECARSFQADMTMPSDSRALQQALEWQVTFWSGEITDTERVAFERWLNGDENNAAAWTQVQNTENKLSSLSVPGAATTLRASRKSASRRKTLQVLGVFAGAGLAAHFVRQTPQWHSLTADYRTARGERREIILPDGTQVTVNTSSAIDVAFDDNQRVIHLRTGEIFIVTGPKLTASGQVPGPLVVQTAEGSVRPVGTQFNVRQEDRKSMISVVEGAVEITPRRGSQAIRLVAGNKTSFGEQSVEPAEANAAAGAAWTKGLLVAERMRLQDFIAELARYRRGFLHCDPAVANLIVSGVFSVDDTEATIASLVEALPVRAQYVSRFWVTIQAT